MATTFDTNAWYRILWQDQSSYTMVAFDPNDSGTGAVTEQSISDLNVNQSRWQILPMGPANTYVLRNNYLGPLWYLSTFWNPNNTAIDTQTHLDIEKFYTVNTVADRAQWIIRPSNGSTDLHYFSCVRNTTKIDLSFKSGAAYLTDPATVTATGSFDWSIVKVAAIDEARWSTSSTSSSATASATSSATSLSSVSTTTPTSSPSSSSSSSSDSSTSSASDGQLSHQSGTPIGAIAGGVIGGVAIFLLLLGALIFWSRKRKQKRQGKPYEAESYLSFKPELEDTPVVSPQYTAGVKAQQGYYGVNPVKSQPTIYEKPTSEDVRQANTTAELPGDADFRH